MNSGCDWAYTLRPATENPEPRRIAPGTLPIAQGEPETCCDD